MRLVVGPATNGRSVKWVALQRTKWVGEERKKWAAEERTWRVLGFGFRV